MPQHPQSKYFQMPVLEAEVATHTIKRFLDGGHALEKRSILVLLVFAVVIIEPKADRGVIARPGGTGRLDGVAAFRVALEVESLRKADVNVFGTTDGVSRIASVDRSEERRVGKECR